MKQQVSMTGKGTSIFIVSLLTLALYSCEAIKISADAVNVSNNNRQMDWDIRYNVAFAGFLTIAGSHGNSGFSPRSAFWNRSDNGAAFGVFYEPQFVQKGMAYDGGYSRLTINYLELPLYLSYRHYASNGNWITAGAGPFASYGAGGSIRTETMQSRVFGDNQNYNRFDAGISGVLDYKFRNGISIGINYDYGLANISNASDQTISTRCVSLSLGYSVGRIVRALRR
jgi:hypothetical protein